MLGMPRCLLPPAQLSEAALGRAKACVQGCASSSYSYSYSYCNGHSSSSRGSKSTRKQCVAALGRHVPGHLWCVHLVCCTLLSGLVVYGKQLVLEARVRA
jgi:hypothetical protein